MRCDLGDGEKQGQGGAFWTKGRTSAKALRSERPVCLRNQIAQSGRWSGRGEVVWEAEGVGGGGSQRGGRGAGQTLGAVEGRHGVRSQGGTCSALCVTVLSPAAVWGADWKAGHEARLQLEVADVARPAGETERSRRR